jgi:hypothetical protein
MNRFPVFPPQFAYNYILGCLEIYKPKNLIEQMFCSPGQAEQYLFDTFGYVVSFPMVEKN